MGASVMCNALNTRYFGLQRVVSDAKLRTGTTKHRASFSAVSAKFLMDEEGRYDSTQIPNLTELGQDLMTTIFSFRQSQPRRPRAVWIRKRHS